MAHTARTQSRLRLPPNARSARVPDAKHTQCLVRREAHTCTQSMSSGCEAHSVPCPSQAHTCPCGMCPGCKALAEPCPSRSTCMLWRRCGRNKLTRKQPDEHVACTRATRTSQMLAQPREARHERLAATCTCCNHTKQRGRLGCIAQPAGASDCSVQLHMRVGGRHKVISHACFACVRKVHAAESTPHSYESQSSARRAMRGRVSHACHEGGSSGMDGGSTRAVGCLLANRRCVLVTDPTHDPTLGRYSRPVTAAHLPTAGNRWIQSLFNAGCACVGDMRALWLQAALHSMVIAKVSAIGMARVPGGTARAASRRGGAAAGGISP